MGIDSVNLSIEHIARIKKKQARVIRKGKTKAKHAVDIVRKPLSRRSQDSEKAEGKRRSNEGRRSVQADPHSSTTGLRETTRLPRAVAPNDIFTIKKPLPDEQTNVLIGTSNPELKLGA